MDSDKQDHPHQIHRRTGAGLIGRRILDIYPDTESGLVMRQDLLSERLGADATLFQRFLDTAPDAMVLVDETGQIVACNEQTYSIFGFPRGGLIGEMVERLVPLRFRPQHPAHRHRYFEDPKVRPMGAGIDLFGVRADGQEFPVEISLSPMHLEGRLLVTAAVRDVTDRKRYEEEIRHSRTRLQEAQALAHIGSWEFEMGSDQVFWSDELFRIYGLEPSPDGIRFEDYLGMVHEEDRAQAERVALEAADTGEPFVFQHRIQPKGGSVRWLLGRGTVEMDETGRPVRMYGTAQDITTLHENEERIRHSLGEKEVLLKEIHHRVKNNLQVIASLLNLQRNTVQDPNARAAFSESRNRIKTMALVHESLYRSSDLSSIRAPEYLGTLIRDLFHSYNEASAKIQLKTSIESLPLPTDIALQCGLILNELISNALKHAFPEGQGTLTVTFRRTPSELIELLVVDDGIGTVAHAEESTGLGLRLVETLVNQLGGNIEISQNGGTKFKVSFPAERPVHTGTEESPP